MGKSTPSPPKPPNYAALAGQQGQQSIDAIRLQAMLSNPDVYGPYGSQVITPIDISGGGVDKFKVTQKLSPQQQRLSDLTEGLKESLAKTAQAQLGRVSSVFSKPFDWAKIPGAPKVGSAFAPTTLGKSPAAIAADAKVRQQVIDAIYKQQTSMLDPQYANLQGQLISNLANQGVVQGSEAYTRAIDDFNRQRALDYAQAREQAIIGGGAEQSRLFGLQSTSRQQAVDDLMSQYLAQTSGRGQQIAEQERLFDFGAQARQQAIQDQMLARGMSLNELNALRTGTQVSLPQYQGFTGAGPITPPNYYGAAQDLFGARQGLYNAQAAQQAANTQGLYSLGGTALGIGAGAFFL